MRTATTSSTSSVLLIRSLATSTGELGCNSSPPEQKADLALALRLTEQYTKILIPSKEAQARLERRSGRPATEEEDRAAKGRREVLKDARERAEWERWESSRRKEAEDAEEADRIAFAEIDWQDFVVVSTVEFTEGDEAGLVELPPPMSISEVENMTLAQKKMAAMIMEGREDEVAENERERERGEEAEMDMDDDDDDAPVADQQARMEQERQRVVQIAATDSSAPMKIRKDYVPKGEFSFRRSSLALADRAFAHSQATSTSYPGLHDLRRSASAR